MIVLIGVIGDEIPDLHAIVTSLQDKNHRRSYSIVKAPLFTLVLTIYVIFSIVFIVQSSS